LIRSSVVDDRKGLLIGTQMTRKIGYSLKEMTRMSKKYTLFKMAMLLCALLFIAPSSADQQTAINPPQPMRTVMTQQQINDRVKQFVHDLGWQTDPNCQPTIDTPLEKNEACRVEGSWDITLGKINIGIYDRTGIVHSFIDDSIYKKYHTGDNIPVNITAEIADANARKVLALAGIPMNELTLLKNHTINDSSDPSTLTWQVMYRRTYHGYPYYQDSAQVRLDPSDGSLRWFGLNFRSPVPDSINSQVAMEDAVKSAQAYCAIQQPSPDALQGAELVIVVCPYDFTSYIGGKESAALPPSAQKARLAWAVSFKCTTGMPYEMVVFIDAAKGTVLGDAHSG
jgi:hypothetical protein